MLHVGSLFPQESVNGFMVGAFSTMVVSAVLNSNKVKSGEKDREAAIKDTLKDTAVGGVALGSAMYAAHKIGNGDWFSAIGGVVLCVGAVYATEKLNTEIVKEA
mgnify:CR=1 FL=1